MQIILVVFASQKVAHYFMLYYEYYGNKCPTFFFQIEKRKEKQETYHCWKNIYFQKRKFPQKVRYWVVKNSIIVQISSVTTSFWDRDPRMRWEFNNLLSYIICSKVIVK